MTARLGWRVIAALAAVTGGVCTGLGAAWGVPVAITWGAFLALLAIVSVLD